MVSELKLKKVNELEKLVTEYPIIGIVNLQSLPAPQLQSLRRSLRGKVEIKMARRRMLQRALEGSEAEKLSGHLSGMPALLFTKDNPFSLFKILDKNKSMAPAKPGQTAPSDIVINAGPTSFAPGPVIGELGSIGLKTGVENGKVTIKQDAVICKKGEIIKPKVAEILKRFGIEPMEIGLNIVAVIEKGIVFMADQLAIDEKVFNAKLTEAITSARNLAVEITFPAKEIVEVIIQKAFREAKAVALDAGVVSKDTIEEMLGKVEYEAIAIKEITK